MKTRKINIILYALLIASIILFFGFYVYLTFYFHKVDDIHLNEGTTTFTWEDCMTSTSTAKEIMKGGFFAGLCLEQPCNKGIFVCSYLLERGGTESRILTGEQIDKLNKGFLK